MRTLQKKEASKRMEKIGFPEWMIGEFRNRGIVAVTETDGSVRPMSMKEISLIRAFENEHDAIAYHVVKSKTNLGIMYSILYVSTEMEEWEYDMEDLEAGQALAYVVNVTYPDCSEFGSIGIEQRNCGVVRTW